MTQIYYHKAKRSAKKAGKSAFNYFEKNPKQTAKLVGWGFIIAIIWLFGSSIYNWINSFFSSGPSEEEQKKLDVINQIYVDKNFVDISEQEVQERISKFKNALIGSNNPKKVYEALTRTIPVGFRYEDRATAKWHIEQYGSSNWAIFQGYYNQHVQWLKDNMVGLLEEYQSLPSSEKLGYHNVRYLYKEFGLQPWGLISTTHGSMQDWITDEESGNDFAFFWEIMDKCDLI